MNEDTAVVVHAYAGDVHQVVHALPQYLHHEAPMLVLSPADAPAIVEGVECRQGGLRAYTGHVALGRQREHLQMLLDRDESWFLLHDSDSVCLEPVLPEYLYADEETVWYNAAPTARFIRARHGPESLIAEIPEVFQPPLFFSRKALERMLEVAEAAMARCPPWARVIDWWFAYMAREAGLSYQAFPLGISRPIWALYEIARVYTSVRCCGTTILHSVKSPEALDLFVTARAEYSADPTGEHACGTW